MTRIYLDHNATTPLRPEARSAMIAAMDLVGNPSSVHAEGRAAKSTIEQARAQVAALVGCKPSQVIFTSGATEAAALAVAQKSRHGGRFLALPTEHDCLLDWSEEELEPVFDKNGFNLDSYTSLLDSLLKQGPQNWQADRGDVALVAISAANSETGLMLPKHHVMCDHHINASQAGTVPYAVVADLVQMAGKVSIEFTGPQRPSYAIVSSHKLGGPKGVGALINFTSQDPLPLFRGGGQEMNRRPGTENVIGIAGFGAATQAAARDLAAGVWDRINEFRNILKKALEAGTNNTIFVGNSESQLPNTLCFATPGWKGETQVMQMDLAGFSISAGSACSSGKVRASRVLKAMGYDDMTAASAIRVSLGPLTTETDVRRFADAWLDKEKKHRARAA